MKTKTHLLNLKLYFDKEIQIADIVEIGNENQTSSVPSKSFNPIHTCGKKFNADTSIQLSKMFIDYLPPIKT